MYLLIHSLIAIENYFKYESEMKLTDRHYNIDGIPIPQIELKFFGNQSKFYELFIKQHSSYSFLNEYKSELNFTLNYNKNKTFKQQFLDHYNNEFFNRFFKINFFGYNETNYNIFPTNGSEYFKTIFTHTNKYNNLIVY